MGLLDLVLEPMVAVSPSLSHSSIGACPSELCPVHVCAYMHAVVAHDMLEWAECFVFGTLLYGLDTALSATYLL